MSANRPESPAATEFGGVLENSPPDFSGAQACAIAREAFGVTAISAKPFIHAAECDQLFHLAADNGAAFTMRIANSAQRLDILDFQNCALDRVAKADPELPLPRVRRTTAGEALRLVSDRQGCHHAVRLLTYLPGVPLLGTKTTPILRRRIGQILARFDLALKDFSHPAMHRNYVWNVMHAATIAALDVDLDDDCRRLLNRAFARFDRHVAPIAHELRAQVLHNDSNPKNILIDPQAPEEITGLIDFGDMTHAPLVFEPAVAVSKVLLDLVDMQFAGLCRLADTDPVAVAGDVLVGYHGLNPLVEEELAIIFDVAMTRLAMRVMIRAWRATRRSDRPLEPALVRSGRTVLEWLLALDRDALAERLSLICKPL